MNVMQIYITNDGFLLTELYELTAINKISKTFLWKSLCKVKYGVLLTLKVCLMDKFK